MEPVAALTALDKMLQQVQHLRIPLGPCATLFLQRLRTIPRRIVDHLRYRNLDPTVPRLFVDLHPVLGGDVAILAVDPGAPVGGICQYVEHAGLKPQLLAGRRGDPLVGQPNRNGMGPHTLMNVHVKDAADDLRMLL